MLYPKITMNLATLVLQNIILKWNLDQELNLIKKQYDVENPAMTP